MTTGIAIAVTAVVAITVTAGLDVGSITGLVLAGLIPVTVGFYSVLMRSASNKSLEIRAIPTIAGLDALCRCRPRRRHAGRTCDQRGVYVALACVSGGIALGLGLPMFNLGHRSVAAARVPLLLMTEVVLALGVDLAGRGPRPRHAVLRAIILGAVVGPDGLVAHETPRCRARQRLAALPADGPA